MKNILGIAISFLLISLAIPGLAQHEFEDIMNMELEDLMNIDIYSVSKKSESLYETPLSSSTLTAEDIYNSGATSIPEALRLVPGVIVREMTNGSYDVHLRGFDNLTRFGDGSSASNQITLVMVDGRPVFNNNLGGTYWEAIPVDLIDIERIEVVRGPAAALYGPNAVAGVINIITKDVNKEGIIAQANLSAGTDNTQVGGLRLGYKFSDKLTAQISGNVQLRDRQDDQNFDYSQNAYVDSNDRFESAVNRKGVNLMLDYRISEDFNIGLQSGFQRAEVTRSYRENAPVVLSELEHDSEYISFTVNKKGLAGRLSYTSGFDNLNKDTGQTLLQYDYHNIDASLEYTVELSEALSLRPGLSYQSSTYNDEDYFDLSDGTVGVLGEERSIDNYAGSLMADIKINDQWRFVAGGRVDKFSTPDESYFSYELATTYTINDKNIVRVLTSRSNSGSFIAPNFLNLNVVPVFYYQGDQNLELFQVQLFEIGYRAKPVNNLELNIELFRQSGKNTNALLAMQPQAPFMADAEYFEYVNLPLEAVQNGVTISANYVPLKSIQFIPFVTFLTTEISDAPAQLTELGLTDLSDVDADQTPSVYGGFYLNVKPVEKFTINVSPYYIGAQQQYNFYDFLNPANTLGEIDARLILNAKVNFAVNKHLDIYLNGRNLLDQGNTEFYGADRTGMLLLAGLKVNF